MAYELDTKAAWLLLNPKKTSLAIAAVGFGGGYLGQTLVDHNLFERFGSLTVALAVLVFGIVAAELLNRAQDGYFSREDNDPNEPTSVQNIRKTLNFQSVLVFLGTLQWGFGGLLFGR